MESAVLSAVQEAKMAEVVGKTGLEVEQVRYQVAGVLHHMRAFGPRRSVRAAAEYLRLHASLVEEVLGADYRVAS